MLLSFSQNWQACVKFLFIFLTRVLMDSWPRSMSCSPKKAAQLTSMSVTGTTSNGWATPSTESCLWLLCGVVGALTWAGWMAWQAAEASANLKVLVSPSRILLLNQCKLWVKAKVMFGFNPIQIWDCNKLKNWISYKWKVWVWNLTLK